MRKFIWVHDRLAWPPVIAVAYVAAALVLADYFWRILVMPFMTFVVCAAVIAIAVPALFAVARLLTRGKFRRSSE